MGTGPSSTARPPSTRHVPVRPQKRLQGAMSSSSFRSWPLPLSGALAPLTTPVVCSGSLPAVRFGGREARRSASGGCLGPAGWRPLGKGRSPPWGKGGLVAPFVRLGQPPPRPPPCRIPSSLDNSLLHAIETIIIDWSHQVRDVLSKDSAQALLDGLQPLPRVEFEFWDARLQNLKCIHDQVRPWLPGPSSPGHAPSRCRRPRAPARARGLRVAPGRLIFSSSPFPAEQAQSEQNRRDPGKSQKLLLAGPAKRVFERHGG